MKEDSSRNFEKAYHRHLSAGLRYWSTFGNLSLVCALFYILAAQYIHLSSRIHNAEKKLLLSMMQTSYMIFVCCSCCLHAKDNQTKLNHRQITTKKWLMYNIHGKDQKQRLKSWWWYQYYIVCLVLKTVVFHFVQFDLISLKWA